MDITRYKTKISDAIDEIKEHNIKVSVFVDPLPENVDLALEVGSDMIEIHTGIFANTVDFTQKVIELEKIRQISSLAKELGIGVNAGHGLNYQNIVALANIDDIEEVSIGHAIIARAVFFGLETAVKEMIEIIRRIRI